MASVIVSMGLWIADWVRVNSAFVRKRQNSKLAAMVAHDEL